MKTSLSLKTRITGITLLLFVASLWGMAYFIAEAQKRDMERLVSEQQLSTVRYMATQIDADIVARLDSLKLLASLMDAELLAAPPRLQQFLDAKPLIAMMFSGGALVIGADGVALADFPTLANRRGTNYRDRDYFKAVMTTGQPYIGKVVTGKAWKRPIQNLAVPIHGKAGEVIGVYVGVSFPDTVGYMGEVTKASYGRGGRYYVISPRDRMYVTSNQRELIMASLPTPGSDAIVNRFAQGGEGTATGVSQGIEVVASAARVPTSGWMVIASLPSSEAFEPVHNMILRIYGAAGIASLLVGLVIWLAMERMLRPLGAAAGELRRMTAGAMPLQAVETERDDEIGDLLKSFNQLQARIHRDEARLRESEERFRTMADFTYDWEYWQGPDNEMLYVTPSCERVTGYPREAFIADPKLVYTIIHPEDRHLMEKHVHDVRHEDSGTLDFRIITKTGEVRWIAHGCRAVFWQGNRFMGRRASNRDITDRKGLENELQKLNANLERRVEEEVAKNREKDHLLIQQSRLAAMGEMVHNIAHQWRQPLSALSIILSNIKDDFDFSELTTERLDENVQQARKLLQRMSTTIDDFRDFFRPDREPCEFEMGKAVEDALFVMDAALQNSGIEVVKELPTGIQAYGFSNQFAQVILNVLVNAREAIVQRQIAQGRITLRLSRSGNRGRLEIEDNAGGIAAGIMPKIFDPYFTTKEKGSGIGLYMSKMIIERSLDGTIEACNLDQGARFTIALPLHEGNAK